MFARLVTESICLGHTFTGTALCLSDALLGLGTLPACGRRFLLCGCPLVFGARGMMSRLQQVLLRLSLPTLSGSAKPRYEHSQHDQRDHHDYEQHNEPR